MVVLNHKLGGLLKIGNHFLEAFTRTKTISSSKDDKNILYFKNDFHYTVKSFFPISSLEVLH